MAVWPRLTLRERDRGAAGVARLACGRIGVQELCGRQGR